MDNTRLKSTMYNIDSLLRLLAAQITEPGQYTIEFVLAQIIQTLASEILDVKNEIMELKGE